MKTQQPNFDVQMIAEIQPLRNYALSLTHNSEDSNDLVQETVLKAYRYKDKFEEGTNLRGWLYTILKNSFINNYRRDQKRNTFLDSTENTFFLDIPSHRIENHAELRFIRKDLEHAIEQLPLELRITFTLNVEGYKYHEIAEELNIPIGTVKTRIFVAKRILREKLASYGNEFGLTSKRA